MKYNSRLIGRVGVTDSMVLFSTGYIFTDGEKSEYPGYFISLDRNSGLMLWRIPLDGESWTGISVSGDIAYLGTLSGSIYAIDLADSNLYDSDPSLRILWKYNTDRAIAGPIFVESNHIKDRAFVKIFREYPDYYKEIMFYHMVVGSDTLSIFS